MIKLHDKIYLSDDIRLTDIPAWGMHDLLQLGEIQLSTDKLTPGEYMSDTTNIASLDFIVNSDYELIVKRIQFTSIGDKKGLYLDSAINLYNCLKDNIDNLEATGTLLNDIFKRGIKAGKGAL